MCVFVCIYTYTHTSVYILNVTWETAGTLCENMFVIPQTVPSSPVASSYNIL